MATFDLNEIYTWLASYKGLPFPINSQAEYLDLDGKGMDRQPLVGYSVQKQVNRINLLTGKEKFSNLYGQPVIVPVTISGIQLGSGEAGHISIQPMVVIEGAKQIVKTPIVGGAYPGTVKEFINFDDYRIRIHGCLVNKNQREYPTEQVELLKHLWSYKEALWFDCELTNDLFSYVVIERLQLDELRMAPGLQFYEIQCISDAVQEVEMLRNDNANA